MHTFLALLSFALLGCSTTTAAVPAEGAVLQREAPAADHFPLPKEALKIPPPGEGGPTMLDLLSEFARVTGQNVRVSAESRQLLKMSPVGLLDGLMVPPAEVYPFVEGLLRQGRFVMVEVRSTEPRLLSIVALDSQEGAFVGPGAVPVPIERIATYERHPALLVQTVIELGDTDARTLANVWRSMLIEPRVEQLLPLGNGNALVLRGTGKQVASWASMLAEVRELDAAERAAAPKEPSKGPAKEPPK